MKYNGAEITIKLLEAQGVRTIAGIPGGANLPLYDALHKSEIRHILARHEQGAAFIAQGMARSNGRPAVCFATSGPGATNLLTAIADAKMDSVPIIAITGQVASSLIGTDAFQEVDTYGMSLPVTKHNFLARNAEELFTIIPEAFRIATSGRPGPVLIDMPKDVQLEQIEISTWPETITETSNPITDPLDSLQLRRIAEMINKAERPLLYIGGGIISSGASALLAELAHKNHIPVTATLMGLGAFPADDPLFIGMLGMHGARYTNMLLDEADLLIAIGARFDDRATGKVEKFCSNASIIHIDVDPAEIDKIKKSNLSLAADAASALSQLLPMICHQTRADWIAQVEKRKETGALPRPASEDLLHPINVIRSIGAFADEDAIVTTDVGQHQMWAAQYYPFHKPRTLLTSGGLGTMGFGLPAAIGAAVANPDKQIICITGDGSLLMNIQELAILADIEMNITIILMNNGHLGLVRQQQELFYGEKYVASRFESQTDFCAIASGFGIKAIRLDQKEDPRKQLQEALKSPGTTFIEVEIDHAENVLPMVAPGAANHEMIGG